jgi:hypothetical protein
MGSTPVNTIMEDEMAIVVGYSDWDFDILVVGEDFCV